MDHEGQLRNLRDFLLVYNRMTEICFQRCTSNFNYRNLTMDEERCVDNCAGKLIRTNHRLMGTYVQLMPAMVQKRMQEMEIKAAEVAKAEAAASALENPSTASTDASTASPSTLGIPDASFPMPESPQISTVINNSSNINTSVTNGPAFGETQSFSDVHTVTNKAQTFTSESLDGLVTQVNSSVHETPSAGRDGQSPQTPS